MKHYLWLPALSAVLAALAALAVVQWQKTPTALCPPADDVAWLDRELRLTPEQRKTILDLAAAHRAELARSCQAHCATRCQLGSMLFKPDLTDGELNVAIEALCRAQMESERATLRYFRRVHAALTPEQRAKYEGLIGQCVCGGSGSAGSGTCQGTCAAPAAGGGGKP